MYLKISLIGENSLIQEVHSPTNNLKEKDLILESIKDIQWYDGYFFLRLNSKYYWICISLFEDDFIYCDCKNICEVLEKYVRLD